MPFTPALPDRQKQVLRFLQEQIAEGVVPSQAQVAAELGISRIVARDHLLALASKGFIEFEEGSRRSIRIIHESLAFLAPNRIPIIGRIAAGAPVLSDENVETYLTVDPSLFSRRVDYLKRVDGESMINLGIYPDDLVGIHETTTVTAGQVIAALVLQPQTEEWEWTLKRLSRDGRTTVLLSENDDQAGYPPIRLEPGRYQPAGVYAGLIRAAPRFK